MAMWFAHLRLTGAIGAGLLTASSAYGADEPQKAAPHEIAAAAPADDWRAIPAEDLLVFDLENGSRIAMELAGDFAPVHVKNIRTLAQAHWFDGTAITRVQDNYVVQWGGGAIDHPLPPNMSAQPPAEYDRPNEGLPFRPLAYPDAYALETGHIGDWPAARADGRAWLPHCYGMVGAGRGSPPDTGSGAELYAVIGHGPRHLDRNLAVVGRIVLGMGILAALPRGGSVMGFYQSEQQVKIRSARLASEMPAEERPRIEVLGGDSLSQWIESRANRPEDFFVRPAGAIDICNALPPLREAERE